MPSIESVQLQAGGPQVGYGMPFGGMYTDVYGVSPQSQTAQDQYWKIIGQGYENQRQQLVRDAFKNDNVWLEGYDWREGVQVDPITGEYSFDPSKIRNPTGRPISEKDIANMRKNFETQLVDSNEDKVQARQQLVGLAQKQIANQARSASQANEQAGFQQELARYKSPDLMAQMVNPQMQAAANQGMATANAAGMAGGSMAQAANRRAAMQGLGQSFAQVVPQAAVQQAGQDFNWQKAREGMISNYYNMKNQRAQQDIQNEMAQTGFQKSMEEYEHNRSMEALKMGAAFAQNMGAAALKTAPVVNPTGG